MQQKQIFKFVLAQNWRKKLGFQIINFVTKHLVSLFSCDIINAILLKVFSIVYGSSFNACQSLTTAYDSFNKWFYKTKLCKGTLEEPKITNSTCTVGIQRSKWCGGTSCLPVLLELHLTILKISFRLQFQVWFTSYEKPPNKIKYYLYILSFPNLVPNSVAQWVRTLTKNLLVMSSNPACIYNFYLFKKI